MARIAQLYTLYNFFNDSLLAFRVLLLVVRNSFSDIDRSRFTCLLVAAFFLRIMTKFIKINTNFVFFVGVFAHFKDFYVILRHKSKPSI